jgi:hypothetical protein
MKIKFILLNLSVLCLLSYNTLAQTATLNEILDLINKDSLKRTVQDMQDFESRLCIKTIGQNRQVAKYFVNRLQNYGIDNARIDSFYATGNNYWIGDYGQYMYNVIGTLKGIGTTDSTVIIGAHLDAIATRPGSILYPTAPGADDNATGCAVMVEMARIIYENGLKPNHNIDFMAYDAEEIGLLGAVYDAEKRRDEKENIIVMLNNDMVGFQSEDEVAVVTLHWYDNAIDVTEKASQALLKYTTVKPFVPSESENGLRKNSDSYAYYLSGFKATFAIEKYFLDNPNYHSENDLTEYLNFEFCRQIARMNFVLLDYYAEIHLPLSVKQDNNKYEQHISLFPNPTLGELRITNYELQITNIDIYDIFGKKVASHSVYPSLQISIDISHLNSGIYFIKIFTERGVVNKKVIKQ